jgi:nickel transport protein
LGGWLVGKLSKPAPYNFFSTHFFLLNSMKKIILPAVLTLAAAALPLLAHDAWVDPLGGPVYKILYGHKVPEPYSVVKVTSLQVLDAMQKPIKFTRTQSKEGVSITPASRPALFVTAFDNGYWVKVGDEKEPRNVRKSALPAGTAGGQSSRPMKWSKTMLSWAPWMAKPVGQRIEFVPVGLAGLPKPGSTLKLHLLLDGKPLANQMVENNSNETGPKTDANGDVTVTVLKGINRYATDHDIMQANEPDAQRLSLTAALVFVAK